MGGPAKGELPGGDGGYRHDARRVRKSSPQLTVEDRGSLSREGEVLQRHGSGLTRRQIAAEVGCSFGTVQKIAEARPVPSS